MIIAVDHHVGLPFLEGLCADLQDQIQLRSVGSKLEKTTFFSAAIPRWQRVTTRAATLACGVVGALIALLELGSTL